MCRLIVSLGSIATAKKYYKALLDSLYKASRYDPYSLALFGPGHESHRDGWGRIFIRIGDGDVEVDYQRSTRPIYIESPTLSLGDDGDESALYVDIVHSREHSSGMPVNILSTHPFEAETSCEYNLYLVHNGAVNKAKLLDLLGVDPESKAAKIHNDTYFLAKYLARRICGSFNISVLRSLAGIVEAALNLGAILVTDEYVEVLVGSYYKLGYNPEASRDFYKMYRGEVDDLTVYLSSTLVDVGEYNPGLPIELVELSNGQYDVYRIWVGDKAIEKIGSYKII